MENLKVGDAAPDFTLSTSGAGTLSLSDLRGKRVVLYFYPEDDTPGCTKEACGFRDAYPDIEERDAVVLGISPDDVASHDRFVSKFGLPFTLLADPDHRVSEAYGAWTLKRNYGREYMGVQRSTFIIGPNGKLEKIWRAVKPDGHAQQVLSFLQS